MRIIAVEVFLQEILIWISFIQRNFAWLLLMDFDQFLLYAHILNFIMYSFIKGQM